MSINFNFINTRIHVNGTEAFFMLNGLYNEVPCLKTWFRELEPALQFDAIIISNIKLKSILNYFNWANNILSQKGVFVVDTSFVSGEKFAIKVIAGHYGDMHFYSIENYFFVEINKSNPELHKLGADVKYFRGAYKELEIDKLNPSTVDELKSRYVERSN